MFCRNNINMSYNKKAVAVQFAGKIQLGAI